MALSKKQKRAREEALKREKDKRHAEAETKKLGKTLRT